MKISIRLLFFAALLAMGITSFKTSADDLGVVKTEAGLVSGTVKDDIHIFKGIPFAAPPVGDLRWKAPQPVHQWGGVKVCDKFSASPMQGSPAPFSMWTEEFLIPKEPISEDCLYLNVWTGARSSKEKRAVLVWIYGGGFQSGGSACPIYDGEAMARKGILFVSINYRVGVFGFFALPELTKESGNNASGNYGILDQIAALKWIQKNIAAFGGDPKKITIAGESAGSFSVSAQMASPLSKNIIAGAIGESGSLLGLNPTASLQDAEKRGADFAASLKANSLADLRAIPAEQLLKATANAGYGRFPVCVDGYFFPKSPLQIFEASEQAHVPLLVGWNSQESGYQGILGQDKPTLENYKKAVEKLYGEKSAEVLRVYNASNDEDVEQVATDLAGDRFIGFSTWKWSDVQSRTGGKPVYRYLYARPRPEMRPEMGNATANLAGGVTRDTSNKAPK